MLQAPPHQRPPKPPPTHAKTSWTPQNPSLRIMLFAGLFTIIDPEELIQADLNAAASIAPTENPTPRTFALDIEDKEDSHDHHNKVFCYPITVFKFSELYHRLPHQSPHNKNTAQNVYQTITDVYPFVNLFHFATTRLFGIWSPLTEQKESTSCVDFVLPLFRPPRSKTSALFTSQRRTANRGGILSILKVLLQ